MSCKLNNPAREIAIAANRQKSCLTNCRNCITGLRMCRTHDGRRFRVCNLRKPFPKLHQKRPVASGLKTILLSSARSNSSRPSIGIHLTLSTVRRCTSPFCSTCPSGSVVPPSSSFPVTTVTCTHNLDRSKHGTRVFLMFVVMDHHTSRCNIVRRNCLVDMHDLWSCLSLVQWETLSTSSMSHEKRKASTKDANALVTKPQSDTRTLATR